MEAGTFFTHPFIAVVESDNFNPFFSTEAIERQESMCSPAWDISFKLNLH